MALLPLLSCNSHITSLSLSLLNTDHTQQTFTNSLQWFSDAKGWKSTQGGLSAIMPMSTDRNNMGGLFVRKIGGAACLIFQVQKLYPMLFHPKNSQWNKGHFHPLFWTSAVCNMILVAFYSVYIFDDLAQDGGGADEIPKLFCAALILESAVMLYYLTTASVKKGMAVKMPQGKTPNSVVSRIVARTHLLVSGAVVIIAGRDLFFPGVIIPYIPRDDIYLEWTGSLIHSPPQSSPEAAEHGMEQAFFVGDKYMQQLMAVNMLILCIYKFVAAFGIRYRNDGGGMMQARMIWKAQALGNVLILYIFRLFADASLSASLDLRWHLMSICYETFILGLYAFL